jgi:hypothetical protein
MVKLSQNGLRFTGSQNWIKMTIKEIKTHFLKQVVAYNFIHIFCYATSPNTSTIFDNIIKYYIHKKLGSLSFDFSNSALNSNEKSLYY